MKDQIISEHQDRAEFKYDGVVVRIEGCVLKPNANEPLMRQAFLPIKPSGFGLRILLDGSEIHREPVSKTASRDSMAVLYLRWESSAQRVDFLGKTSSHTMLFRLSQDSDLNITEKKEIDSRQFVLIPSCLKITVDGIPVVTGVPLKWFFRELFKIFRKKI